ncbi:hypothetical protein EDD86DRAFT_211395 [Gorgonomyces haynaldii]|nr:hypothetical protein EDD86DRAFT_211395 [Gorgonomyces haynaldii]
MEVKMRNDLKKRSESQKAILQRSLDDLFDTRHKNGVDPAVMQRIQKSLKRPVTARFSTRQEMNHKISQAIESVPDCVGKLPDYVLEWITQQTKLTFYHLDGQTLKSPRIQKQALKKTTELELFEKSRPMTCPLPIDKEDTKEEEKKFKYLRRRSKAITIPQPVVQTVQTADSQVVETTETLKTIETLEIKSVHETESEIDISWEQVHEPIPDPFANLCSQ